MELARENMGNVAVIRCLEDRLDASAAVQFKDGFRGLTDDATAHYVLDMSNVQFMDSSGLGAVVAVYKFIGLERRFDIAGLTPMVARVFKLTKMDSVFTIYETMDEMLASELAGIARQKAS